jgi:hypothetical protein
LGIAQHKPVGDLPTKPDLPQIQPQNYKSIVYDDKNIPLQSLIAYVEGAPWTVDFYNQIVSEHNDLREIDPGQPGVYQQYSEIKGLEIRVTTALVTSYDQESGISKVTGSAMVYPFMTPHKVDYFVSGTADNQVALFRITQVDRKTFNRDSAYSIDYELVGFVSTQPAGTFYAALQDRTMKSYHFSKARLLEGLSPILNSDDFQKVLGLSAVYSDLCRFYFRTFFDRMYYTLVLPGQIDTFYDPFLLAHIHRTVETTDAPEAGDIKELSTDNDRFVNQTQFWDLIQHKDYEGRKICNQVMGLVSRGSFNTNSFLHSFRFLNMEYMLYPVDPDTSTLVGPDMVACQGIKTITMQEIVETTGYKGSVYSDLDNTYTDALGTYKLIHPVLIDNKYVLSDNFYSDTAEQSILEILVKDYMKGQTLDLAKLYAVCNVYRRWNRLEQFYYGPLLMTLLKEANRAQYS